MKELLKELKKKKKSFEMGYFIYPTDAQLGCSKNVKIYIKIYMRGAATCFGSPQPSSGTSSRSLRYPELCGSMLTVA